MKKILILVILAFTCCILSQLFAEAVAINTFPYQESFEGSTFPPAGWSVNPMFAPGIFSLNSAEQTNPVVPGAIDGNNWVNMAAGNDGLITSPKFEFPSGSEFYQLSISGYCFSPSSMIFRVRMGSDTNPNSSEQVDVWNMGNDAEWNGSRWRTLTDHLGFMDGSAKYFFIGGQAWGADLNFDDFRITAGPPVLEVTPANHAVDIRPTTAFWWGISNSAYTYSVYISTDSLNYNLLYTGTSNQNTPDNPLNIETTYYWYVQIQDNLGHSVNTPVCSFTTRGNTPMPGEIVDFPYLDDFQVDDLSWNNTANLNVGKSIPEAQDMDALGKKIFGIKKGSTREQVQYAERCLDGGVNYAMKMPSAQNGVLGILFSPFVRLVAGTTYEVKFNYRVSQPMGNEGGGLFAFYQAPGSTEEMMNTYFMITNTDYALSRVIITPTRTDDYLFFFYYYSSVDIYIDNFRISMNGEDKVTASGDANGGVVDLNPAPIYDSTTGLELDTELQITNITGDPTVNATLYWTTPDPLLNNSGLSLVLNVSAGSLSGAIITFTHNLGFTPGSISYRFIPNGFTTIFNPNDGTWTNTQCTFTVPAVKANGDFEVVFNNRAEVELPVELSSFTAAVTSSYYVSLQWVTQSETNHMGFNVLRSAMNNLSSATKLNTSLISNGVSAGTQTTYNFAYQDEAMDSPYYFWLESVSQSGSTEYFGPLMASAGSNPDTPSVIPAFTCLLNAYPNPFKESTSLRYDLKDAQNVRIDIYNVKGQLIRSYIDNNKAAGTYTATWDGTDTNGKALASGIYFYRMVTKDYTDMKKMMLVR